MGNGNSHRHQSDSAVTRITVKSARSKNFNRGLPKLDISAQPWESKEAVRKNIKAVVEIYRNPRPTVIEEKSDGVIVFRTPIMRAKATLTVPPVPTGQVWTIGWVQSCNYMNFVNVYGGYGFTSWEFPQLNTGLAGVNDSDGEAYPFYGREKEICQLVGPITKETTFVVSMGDKPTSYVTLRVPIKHGAPDGVDLTNIHRKQRFSLWLVAFNDTNGDCIELECLEWELDVAMRIDNRATRGSRVQLLEPKVQPTPRINDMKPRVPQCAKSPPDANHAQMLVFRPHDSRNDVKLIKIIVAPKVRGHTTPTAKELENDKVYELANRCLSSR